MVRRDLLAGDKGRGSVGGSIMIFRSKERANRPILIHHLRLLLYMFTVKIWQIEWKFDQWLNFKAIANILNHIKNSHGQSGMADEYFSFI